MPSAIGFRRSAQPHGTFYEMAKRGGDKDLNPKDRAGALPVGAGFLRSHSQHAVATFCSTIEQRSDSQRRRSQSASAVSFGRVDMIQHAIRKQRKIEQKETKRELRQAGQR